MESFEDYPGKRSTQATSVVTETDRLLSKLGHGYKRAKAQQILRLLKDQECLNQRFRDCALDEVDDDDENGSDGQDSVAGNVGDPPVMVSEKTQRTNKNESRKRVTSNVDPSRCRTSMGFYNGAECSESVDGDDYGNISDFEAETDAAILEEREAMLGQLPQGNRFGNGKGRRLFRLQLDETEVIPEEHTIQSARSSRPKTSIVSGSARGKQYRRPSQTESHSRTNTNSTISTSVSKLEHPTTPRGGNIRGFCDNLQDGILQLTPRFKEVTGNNNARADDISQCFTPRAYDAITNSRRQFNDMPSYLIPRQNDTAMSPLTPRHGEAARKTDLITTPRATSHHRTVLNYYSSQATPRDDFAQYVATPRFDDQSGMITPRTYNSLKQQGGVIRNHLYDSASQSNNDASKSKRQGAKNACSLASTVQSPLTPRSILSVDQSPIHVIPTTAQDGEVTPRRPKKESKSKARADLQRTGAHTNLSKLSERVHPITMMKLPPLEVAINKSVIY